MKDSMSLFDAVSNNVHLKKAPLILFLNKVDLFKKFLNLHPLNEHFPEYTGGANVEEGLSLISSKFANMNESATRSLYIHFTHATDTTSFKKLIGNITKIIIRNNLDMCGIW